MNYRKLEIIVGLVQFFLWTLNKNRFWKLITKCVCVFAFGVSISGVMNNVSKMNLIQRCIEIHL